MLQYRDFAATNQPDTCLWCGRKLHGAVPCFPEYAGYDDDGYFCTLRCGYRFGVRMAELGKRLKLKTVMNAPTRANDKEHQR